MHLALLLALALGSADAQNRLWLPLSFAGERPFARFGAAVFYDSDAHEVVLSGGAALDMAFADAWAFDGNSWRADPIGTPAVRLWGAAAYDAHEKEGVYFGGSVLGPDGKPLHFADTWIWSGGWATLPTDVAPTARSSAMMAYDAAHKQVILFGGLAKSGPVGDTWRFRNNAWEPVDASGPPPRFGGGLVYDSHREVLVLFGGNGDPELFADTWTWDGRSWQQQSPAHSPSPRYGHATVFDADRNTVIVAGGQVDSGNAHASDINDRIDVWEWDGNDWHETSPADGPTPRAFGAAAYTPDERRTMLLGGITGDRVLQQDHWAYVAKRSHFGCAAFGPSFPATFLTAWFLLRKGCRRRRD